MKPDFEQIRSSYDPLWVEHGYGNRFQGFQNLMRLRISDILLVSSLYDRYLFEEDGRLYELIRNEYQGFNLSHSPELTRVSSGSGAISLAKEENRFGLIITTLHIDDMHATDFAKMVRKAGITVPIVLLAHDNHELKELMLHDDASIFNKIFIWQGDFRIIIAIVKYLEDRMNVDHDTRLVGVQTVIVIEDSIRDYSSFLPIIYTEILKQSQQLISEGINLTHKFLRMRARPKILLSSTYEEARKYYDEYKENMLGIISDVDFPWNGVRNAHAGIEFARQVKEEDPDLPILLMSDNPQNEAHAHKVQASFVLKDSPTLLNELRQFMRHYFSFGDFIFRMPDGFEIVRAKDLKSLEEQLHVVPDESIRYHAERNHFSNWLKARTEFWLAHQLRPRKVTDYPTTQALRLDLIASLRAYSVFRQRGIIADFAKETFDPESSFARIGGGSLGGKARGLGFINTLINDYSVRERFEGTDIYIPPAVVVGTDVFDQFVDENDLRKFAMGCSDDKEITRRFLDAERFPEEVLGQLAAFLDLVRTPLAVRSSSLLEDSQYHPFAGVYETYMIPNNAANPLVRLNDLLRSLRRVYASTFYQSAKDYIKVTSYRLEEEKMAVIIQKMIGRLHHDRFYPDFSGVAKSHNFYPLPPQTPSDGIASVGLGLGKWVVDGGNAVRFCPKYPTDLIQFYSAEESLNTSQREFFALDLNPSSDFRIETHDMLVKRYGLDVAEQDGTLHNVGSTYSPDNDHVYDGIARPGTRLVTFGPVLRHRLFPLPQIIELLTDMGSWGMGTPVEIEFAVNMTALPGKPREFGMLQMRPLVLSREAEELDLDEVASGSCICISDQVLGNGVLRDIHDVVMVDIRRFERARSLEVAKEVTYFNGILRADQRPYLLIGVGRWGTLDPWLGIPIRWDQICGARAIVETNLKDMDVAPSQGSHFFQNITSFMVGYFTVSPKAKESFLDWDWLFAQPALEEMNFTRLIRFTHPIVVKMNGHQNRGVILKPEEGIEK